MTVQNLSGSLLLVIGAVVLISTFVRSRREGASQQRGILGRLGPFIIALILLFLGVALVLPARNATPTPGANTNPVDEQLENND